MSHVHRFACGLCCLLGAFATSVHAQDASLEGVRPAETLRLDVEDVVDLGRMFATDERHIDARRIRDLLAKRADPGWVTGRVFHSVRPKSGQSLLSDPEGFRDATPLPDIRISLTRLDATEAMFGPVRTTIAGVFVTQRVPPGRYQLCAEGDGWQTHCRRFELGGGRRHLEPFAMRPDALPDTGSIIGHVALSDGGFPVIDLPAASLLKAAKVTAFSTNGALLREAFVNALGDYVLPGLPAGARTRLVVSLENQATVRNVPPLSIPSRGVLRQDITFDNARPVVTDPIAELNGITVHAAPREATLRVSMDVSDPDGDAAEVRWLLEAGGGTLASTSGPSTTWTLPDAARSNRLLAVISDGKGGVRTRTLRVTSGSGELFTGVVSATDLPALPNAEVEINGRIATTNSAGYFSLEVKPADRYVLNIRSPGHALFGQVYARAMTGTRFELVRATVQRVDPRADIVVTDNRSAHDCRGAPSAGLRWEEVAQIRRQPIRLGAPVRDDRPPESDKGMLDFVDLPSSVSPQRKRRHDCGPGASVRIPANALVDAAGKPPTGAVDVAISTYDIEAEMEMPGDYTISDEGRTEWIGTMESYGAAFVEVRDGATEYNLAPGASAELVIPVAQAQLATGAPLDPEIPIFHYDEGVGTWHRTGDATLDGQRYVASVAHFSAINADVEKADPACIHVRTSDADAMPDRFVLEVTVPADPGSGAAARTFSAAIDAARDDDHVVYNLPVDRNIVLVPYDPVSEVPFGTFVVDSGAPHGDPVNPPDHTRCERTAELFIPDAPRMLPTGVEYLQGLTSFFAYDVTDDPASNPTYAQDLLDATADYYARVDPLVGRRDTFGQFKALWGFDGTEANARYANSADLGFGRDMHCTSADLDGDGDEEVACYVSNYGERRDDDQDNANWASSRDETRYVATVAMEWAPIEIAGSEANPTFDTAVGDVVKFFVYGPDPDDGVDGDGNGDPGDDHDEGILLDTANLDGYGARPVPQLCMVCHGGSVPNEATFDSDGNPLPAVLPVFDSAAAVDLGARFLPFDLDSYTLPNAGPVIGEQQAAFKELNQDYVAITDTSTAIDEVLDELYAPGGTSPTQNRGFVVGGWAGNAASAAMYEHVVGPNCRICHVAHDAPGLSFRTEAGLSPGFAAPIVCGERSMPHSVRTYERFWTSLGPHQPGQLVNYMVDGGAASGAANCTFPPNNGQTFELP